MGEKKALLLDRIASARTAHERMFGLAFPAVRFVDAADIGSLDYRINIHGVMYGSGQLHPDRMLAIAQGDDAPRLAGIEGRILQRFGHAGKIGTRFEGPSA